MLHSLTGMTWGNKNSLVPLILPGDFIMNKLILIVTMKLLGGSEDKYKI